MVSCCLTKFPDLKGLCDHIHAQGLKAGIYTSPGDWTCGGYVGAYGHEAADIGQFARWGFDFLKYDLCGYKCILKDPNSREELIKPYKLVSDLLKKQDRDIVFNLCEYGMAEVWLWGGQVGNCWRTTGDLGLAERRNLPGFLRNRPKQCPAPQVCQAGPVERSRLSLDRFGRRRPKHGKGPTNGPHVRRAVFLHVDVVSDGRPTDFQR